MEDRARIILEGVYTNAGFTLDDVPSRPLYTDHTPRLLELELIFYVLSRPDLP
jgi:hypothetical protein